MDKVVDGIIIYLFLTTISSGGSSDVIADIILIGDASPKPVHIIEKPEPPMNITILNLSNKNITENGVLTTENFNVILSSVSIVDEMGAENIKYLNLSNNFLTTINKGVLSLVQNVVDIDLSFNYLDRVTVDSLQFLKNVNFNNNTISYVKMENLPKLEGIYLSHQEISNFKFMQMPELIVVMLDHNLISELNMNSFVLIPKLELLDLSHNSIENIKRDTFLKLKTLKFINLSHNRLLSVAFSFFSDMTLMDVSHNFIKEVISGTFSNDSTIYSINFSHNRITTLRRSSYPKGLKALYLNHNLLQDIESGAMKYLKSLDVFEIQYNDLMNVSEYDFEAIKNITDLRDFNSGIIFKNQ